MNTGRNTMLITGAFVLTLLVTPLLLAAPEALRPAIGLTVTRGDDRNGTCVPGDCSLREAVNAANASVTDDTINFAAGLTTITLTNEIVINNAGALVINGPGALHLTIDGGPGTNRIFYVNQATVAISRVTLTGGSVPTNTGGAVLATEASMTFDRVHVRGNVAGFGGGLALIGGEHRILNSTISANTSSDEGGGIESNSASLAIANTTISGNTSYAGGGILSSYGTLSLRNSTITNNNNSGLASDHSTITFGNTIIAGNSNAVFPTYVPEVSCYCTITSAGGNLVGDSPGDSTSTGVISIVYQPTDLRDTDPQLGVLQNNGGSTPTHSLVGASPAIDKGLNLLATDPSGGDPLAFDQRGIGFPRIRDGNGDNIPVVDIGAFEVQPVKVAHLEELYAAVNNPQNAGMLIIIAPGAYMLSANDPNGAARPNGGRIELQENMSLQGVVGDRGAVVIDAINLPTSSFDSAPPIALTGAIRMGRGTNAVEWLTVRNAVNGVSNIDTDLVAPGTVYIRIAHVASSNGQRGIDVRNIGAAMAGRVIEADIIDNDIYNNTSGAFGEGLRIVNNQGANGGVISATLIGNRSYNNYIGLLVIHQRSNFANTSVISSGDRFFENGNGAFIGAGVSIDSTPANGNTTSFTATGSTFENNNGISNFDVGGLVIIGGENTSITNGTSNNTVNVELRSCRLGNNQQYDLAVWGARSTPASIGAPGTNNHVDLSLLGVNRIFVVEVFVDSIPIVAGSMNTVTVTRWPKY